MDCPACGRALLDDAIGGASGTATCPHCGAALTTVPAAPDAVIPGGLRCPHCGTVNSQTAPLCRSCGRALAAGATAAPTIARCASCGAANSSSAQVCRVCGAALAAVTQPPADRGQAPAPVAAGQPPVAAAPSAPRTQYVSQPPLTEPRMPGLGAGAVGPMNLGACLDRSFAVFKRNIGPMVLAAACVNVPMSVVLALIALGSYQMNPGLMDLVSGDPAAWRGLVASAGAGDEAGRIRALMGDRTTMDVGAVALVYLGQLVLGLVMALTYPCLWGVTATLAAQSHLGRDSDVRAAWRAVRESYWQLVGVAMILGVIFTFSSCLAVFILPLFIAAPYAVLFEKRGVMGAIGRSVNLLASDYARVLGWYVAAVLVLGCLTQGVSLAFTTAATFGTRPLLPDGSPLPVLLANCTPTLVETLFASIFIVFQTLVYFDARARKEAFDLNVRLGRALPVGG